MAGLTVLQEFLKAENVGLRMLLYTLDVPLGSLKPAD